MASTYGTGTALQFTDATQRQVLELGSKIHYYNPSHTPMLTLMGRMSTNVTPVPIFEWMEDEYNVQKSIVIAAANLTADAEVVDSATGGTDGHQSIILLPQLSQMELFEVGGIYTISCSSGQGESNTHFVCIKTGKSVNLASPKDRHVQFVGGTVSGTTWTYNQVADATDMFTDNEATTITQVGRINSLTSTNSRHPREWGVDGASIANGETASFAGLSGYKEGAGVGIDTAKKVRRLKNCTQIFREPYTITGTAQAAKHYGGSEMSRLQARKLAKIKTDIEYAILTNGDYSLDATSENPQRTFAGFGIGGSAGTGFVQSLDARSATEDTSLILDFDAATHASVDAACELIFRDQLAGSMSRTLFCSNKWLRFFANIMRNGVGPGGTAQLVNQGNYSPGNKNATDGLRVTSYVAAVGELNLIPHPLLNGALEDYALAVAMANVDIRPLASRDMQLRSDIVKDGQDGRTDEWLMEVGVEVRNEQTHAILKFS